MYYEATDQSDLNFDSMTFAFYNFNCISVNKYPTANINKYECSDCIQESFINTVNPRMCQICDPGCRQCTALGTCSVARCDVEGLFYDSSSNTCKFCSLSCRSCTSASFYGCKSCKSGFYFLPNEYDTAGSCLTCHANCKECWGPLSTDCAEAARGFYISSSGPSGVRDSFPCDPSCAACEGTATYCTSCVYDLAGLDSYKLDVSTHTCSVFDTSSIWPDCLEYAVYPDSSTGCNYCFMQGSPHPWKRECTPIIGFTRCGLVSLTNDPREVKCSECATAGGLNVLTGDCRYIGTAGDNCKIRMIYAQMPFCMQCDAGWYADVVTGLCVSACTAGNIPVFFGGGDVCFPAPPGCLAATIDGTNELFCTTCDTANNFIKDQPTDKQCINLVCNNAALTANKQCTPVVNPGLCDSNLCFWTNNIDECPTPATCARKVFELGFSELGFVINIRQAYKFYLSYDIADFAVYDTSVANEKRVLCRLVSDDLNDELSRCTYKNGALHIEAIDIKYRQIVAQATINLKPSAFKIYRKLLNIQNNNLMDSGFGYGFAINTNCPLNSQLTRGASNWIIVYQSSMPWTEGIKAEIFQRTNKYAIQTYSWSCVSVGANAALVTQLNAMLVGFDNKPLSIILSNVAYQNLPIIIQATVLDEYGQSYTIPMSFTLVTNTPLFSQPKAEPVYFTYRDTGVFVPLLTSTATININNVVVTGTDLPVGGFISTTLTQLSSHYLLKVVVTNWQDFRVTVSYPGRSDLVLQFVYLSGNYPSSIITEESADNITPWVFQLGTRQSIVKVLCIDETAATSCLPGAAAAKVFAPGEQVTLQDNFIFAAERSVRVFLRLGNYIDETVTSFLINAKTSAQQKTPVVTYRSTTTNPESPYHSTTLGYYLSSRVDKFGGLGALTQSYVDAQTLTTASVSATYTLDSSELQIPQSGPAVSSHFFSSKLQFTLAGGPSHKLLESRFISPVQTHAFSAKIVTGTADFNNLDMISGLLPSGNTCNDSPFQFTHVYQIGQKVYLAETSRFMRRAIMLGTFATNPIAVEATTYTHCGPQKSTSVNVVDSTGLAFSNTLQYYLNRLLLNLGNSARDQMNNLNVALFHLIRAQDDCVASAPTCRTSVDYVRTQALTLLTKIPVTFENSRFGMLVRYSFLNGFVTGNRLAVNDSVTTVLTALEATSTYISDKLDVPMGAHPRFSRDLSLAASDLDLLLPEMLDYPISVASNLLNAFLFGYAKDTDRNDMVQRTITQIVRHTEIKMLRSSAHKRLETYQDSSVKVQAMTVLEPLDNTYQFLLSDASLLVFKGIKFAAAASYYEIVVISWENDLLTRMKPLYNETTSDYKKRNFYVDFMNYFKQNTPIEGEVQIYAPDCEATSAVATCTVVTLLAPYDGYKFCDCLPAPTTTGMSPTATPLPPVTPPVTVSPTQPSGPTGGQTTPTPQPTIPFVPPLVSSNTNKLSPQRWANYKLWGISTLIIEGVLLALMLIFLYFKNSLLLWSMSYCNYLGSKMLVHKMYARLVQSSSTCANCGTCAAALRIYNDDIRWDRGPMGGRCSSSQSSKSERDVVRDEYLELRKIKRLPLYDLETNDFTRLDFMSHYLKYLKLGHNFASLIYLKSNRHSKAMQILFVFMRLFVHLALSMFFTLGSFEKEDGLSADNWIIKAFYIPLPLWIFNAVARSLLANTITNLQLKEEPAQKPDLPAEVEDIEAPSMEPAQEHRADMEESTIKRTESNQQLVGFKKLNSGSTGDHSPLEKPEPEPAPHNPFVSRKSHVQMKSISGSSAHHKTPKKSNNVRGPGVSSVTPDNSKVIRKSLSSEELNYPKRVRIPSESAIPITPTLPDRSQLLQPQAKRKAAAEPKQTKAPETPGCWQRKVFLRSILGWMFVSLILGASGYVIFSISLGGDRDSTNWPWGLWYAFSLLIDLCLLQPALTFCYFILVWRYYNAGSLGCMARMLTSFFISSDVKDAFSAHLHHLDNKD